MLIKQRYIFFYGFLKRSRLDPAQRKITKCFFHVCYVTSSTLVLLQHDTDRSTISGYSRSFKRRKQKIFLFPMMAFINKNRQKFQNPF